MDIHLHPFRRGLSLWTCPYPSQASARPLSLIHLIAPSPEKRMNKSEGVIINVDSKGITEKDWHSRNRRPTVPFLYLLREKSHEQRTVFTVIAFPYCKGHWKTRWQPSHTQVELAMKYSAQTKPQGGSLARVGGGRANQMATNEMLSFYQVTTVGGLTYLDRILPILLLGNDSGKVFMTVVTYKMERHGVSSLKGVYYE